MSMDEQGCEVDISHAASAVLVSLLKALIDKDVLTGMDVRALLTRAAAEIRPHGYAAPVRGAAGIILNDLLPMFPEDGGD
jgi:hypothetical protein